MATDIGIVDLLKLFGFDDSLPTKLVRHQDARYDVPALLRDGWFELYQSLQAKTVFKGCQQLVAFSGDGSGRARLIGVYRVKGQTGPDTHTLPANCPFPEWGTESHYRYDLERLTAFDTLAGRVVIDWGDSPLAWHQHLRNKPVVEVFPPGRSLDPFTDYLGFTLAHHELLALAANPAAHRDWVTSLSAVAGVYLILATSTGAQYVGSACGTGGVWGRWLQYAGNGHGGNEKLKELLATDPLYPSAFRYSLLQVLPKSTTMPEVVRWEGLYKAKLGSRATGLNLN